MNKLRITAEVGFPLLVISLLGGCLGGSGSEQGSSGGWTAPVTTGLLQSLTIVPTASSVAACVPVQYTATAYYSDATSRVVTTLVNWEVDPANSGVAIANAASGVFAGIAAGSAVVHAWTGQGIAASAVLNITGGSLNSIAITPASSTLSSTIAASGTQAYTALATCSNGTLDIAAMNIWTSSNSGVATVGVSGVATAVAAGSAVISATAGTVAASAILNVQ